MAELWCNSGSPVASYSHNTHWIWMFEKAEPSYQLDKQNLSTYVEICQNDTRKSIQLFLTAIYVMIRSGWERFWRYHPDGQCRAGWGVSRPQPNSGLEPEGWVDSPQLHPPAKAMLCRESRMRPRLALNYSLPPDLQACTGRCLHQTLLCRGAWDTMFETLECLRLVTTHVRWSRNLQSVF